MASDRVLSGLSEFRSNSNLTVITIYNNLCVYKILLTFFRYTTDPKRSRDKRKEARNDEEVSGMIIVCVCVYNVCQSHTHMQYRIAGNFRMVLNFVFFA